MAATKSGANEIREDQASWTNVIGEARTLAQTLPALLIEAQQIANSVIAGLHGRRRPGPGESFWQFRPFNVGEPAKRIDWRRSARDEHLYVREREWEASQTVWLWSDFSRSMTYQSALTQSSKRDRAILLQLCLSDMLADAGERVGVPGLLQPVSDRRAAERVANALLHSTKSDALPETSQIQRNSNVIVMSDFLDPIEEVAAWINRAAGTGARGHIVQIIDPIEESFPFSGRIEFLDVENGTQLTTGRAQDWKDAYQQRWTSHQAALKDLARSNGWGFVQHHTDRPATEPLLSLFNLLTSGTGTGTQMGAM